MKKNIEMDTAADAKGFYLQFGNAQHIGARNNQEDAFGFSDISPEATQTRGVFAVLCDGMGGLSGGRETAMATVSAVLSAAKCHDFRHGFDSKITAVIEAIGKQVYEQYNLKSFQTGATLAVAYVYEDKLYFACVGDSRIYLVRNGTMTALNEDHDRLNQLLDEYIDGDRSFASAFEDRQKDNLASFIGAKKRKIDVSRKPLLLKTGDRILLCSDGIYNSISECEMLRLLANRHAQASCDAIVETITAKATPAQDNMTVMVIGAVPCDSKNKKGKKR